MDLELNVKIEKALEKVHSTQEKDLCRYVPALAGEGHIHHFTFRKLKHQNPTLFISLLKKYILETSVPHPFPPKKRSPKGLRKKRELFAVSKDEMGMLVDAAKKFGYLDVVKKFQPSRSLNSLKRELIKSIKNNEVDQVLWTFYAEMVGGGSD